MKKKQLLRTGISLLLASAMMITSVPATSQAAPVETVDTVYGADAVESLAPGYYLTVYSRTTYSYAVANTAEGRGTNLDQEAQSVYMAVSKDGREFEVLNSGGGVIFSKNPDGTWRITDPRVYKDGDGFKVVAPDSNASKGIHVFTSTDGVHYYDDEIVTSTELEAAPLSKEKFTLMLNGENLLETDQTITLGNAIALTEEEYTFIVNKLGTVVNTGLESLQDLSVMTTDTVTEKTLAEKYPSVNATYSDKSTQKFNIDWTDALKGVDLNKAGTYTVNGKVIQPKYLNNLKELNGSTLPEDDPEKVGGAEYPDNVNPDTGEVYYDETKFIEGMADPFIYWDEQTGYYYMTASYFPEEGDALPGERPVEYDRVVLRRGRTLEELQTRGKQVTIWKVGNQGYDDNGKEVARGYRYIWAPEIHRVGNNWVVYFTESHGSSNAYDIYSHALVLDGNQDPYDTALELSDQKSDWKDYKMRKDESLDASVTDPFSLSFCLDMTYFKDEASGIPYVIWAGRPTASVGGSSTDLFIATVNEEEPWKITSEATRITYSEYGWERIVYHVNEGPTVLQHDGNIFLCYSASGTGSEYSIGMCNATAGADLLNIDNWTKSPYPLLAARDVNGEEGPGHNSFTVDEDGNVIFVYHARPTSHNYKLCGSTNSALTDPCRHARLKRVHWAFDGTPILKMTYDNELLEEYQTVSVKINVAAPSINLDKTTLGLAAGSSATLKATVVPSSAAVTWSSSNTSVATVANGKVTAKKAGTANITATDSNGNSASCKVTVVSLNQTKVTLAVGETYTLKVSGSSNVTWSSSSTGKASVSKGKITAKKAGKVTISAKAEGVTLKCTVTVKAAPKLVLSSKKKVTLYAKDKKKKTSQIKVSLSPKNSAGGIKYATSNKKVATVSSKGKITAKKKGKANITISSKTNSKVKKVVIKVTVK